ncbi:GNAT family N-acetyltransferase [Kitasatospora sp. NPDC051170]|uniref:GNAT family N-acetyltransferase n=1 Tax=Kitasatospora sp. NPDC051170 TaxID=3364056 RepID=UPI0037895948
MLRRFEGEADLAELFRVVEESVEHLRPWMPWVAEHGVEKTREYLARQPGQWESGEEYNYALVLDGAIVGSVGLSPCGDAPVAGREIGYWLHPAATGRGLMTRAVGALVEEAFRVPGVEYVEVAHDVTNLASGGVPERLGFGVHRRRSVEPQALGETGEEQVWRLTCGEARGR